MLRCTAWFRAGGRSREGRPQPLLTGCCHPVPLLVMLRAGGSTRDEKVIKLIEAVEALKAQVGIPVSPGALFPAVRVFMC